MAEVDYIIPNNPDIIPVEVKSGTQGGMKSLWLFMREKQVRRAVRCSLENFGQFDYVDREDNDSVRHVDICPLYAMAQMGSLRQ